MKHHEDHPAVKLLTRLLSVPSPPGDESRLAQVVRTALDELGFPHETDPAGNVLVRLAGRDASAGTLVMASHMDEIGIVVTGIEADGRLRINRTGGLVPYKIGERPVTILGDGEPITGILSIGSTHTADSNTRGITWGDVRIITGLSPTQLKAAGIRVGSTAVPTTQGRGPILLGDPDDPLIAAWTFDDRAGVMTLLRLLAEIKRLSLTPHRPTIVAFTTHEEGGCHGAKALAHRERPEVFLAVDGCPMPPGSGLVLDGRPCTWSKDLKGHLDIRLVRDLNRIAAEAGVELQQVVLDAAYSDATAVLDAGAAPRVGIVGHVRENSHGFEVTKLAIFDNLLRVLVRFVQTWR